MGMLGTGYLGITREETRKGSAIRPGGVGEMKLVDGELGERRDAIDGRKVGMRSCGVLGRRRYTNPGEEGTGSRKGDQLL